jgi:CHAP domain
VQPARTPGSGNAAQHASKRPPSSQQARRRTRTGHTLVALALVLALVAVVEVFTHLVSGHPSGSTASIPLSGNDPLPATHGALSLRQRIVAIAESQLGYQTDPSNTYCNKFSSYWDAGNNDCSNSNLDEEWCADFAAWVWQKAGASVTYQFINGDINSSAASFYEWGKRLGTWHPAGSGYVPQPGDVAVYGLDPSTLVAQHVAIVVSYTSGDRGPNVVNGDGDRSAFSIVELGNDQYKADISGSAADLSGFTSPTPAT